MLNKVVTVNMGCINCFSVRKIQWSCLLFMFSTQEGVGDTPDSYAYDGNRVRKWNVTTTNYGKVKKNTVKIDFYK